MATSIDTSAFARGFQSVFQLLSAEQVEKLRHLKQDEELDRRIKYLAERANEGELTLEEEAEYSGYVEANSLLAGLHAATKRLDAVLALTREIFKTTATAAFESDAEFDESYFLISVITLGSVEEAVAMYHEWHQKLPTVAASDASHFRLNMDVQ